MTTNEPTTTVNLHLACSHIVTLTIFSKFAGPEYQPERFLCEQGCGTVAAGRETQAVTKITTGPLPRRRPSATRRQRLACAELDWDVIRRREEDPEVQPIIVGEADGV